MVILVGFFSRVFYYTAGGYIMEKLGGGILLLILNTSLHSEIPLAGFLKYCLSSFFHILWTYYVCLFSIHSIVTSLQSDGDGTNIAAFHMLKKALLIMQSVISVINSSQNPWPLAQDVRYLWLTPYLGIEPSSLFSFPHSPVSALHSAPVPSPSVPLHHQRYFAPIVMFTEGAHFLLGKNGRMFWFKG